MRIYTFNPQPDNPQVTNDRPLDFRTPCGCGCDIRDGPNEGYVTCVNEAGGFSLIAETIEERAQIMHALKVLRAEAKRGIDA